MLAGLGVLIALIGLGLVDGGGYLIVLGGSWYFLLMGLAMLVSGLMIARRKPQSAWLYGLALILTAIWAVWDAWAHWGNTTAGNRFAALDQINKGNIDKLQVAWTFRTGDIPQSTGAGAEDQNTPLQIGDTVYTCTAYGKVFALDADTGAQRWKFDPQGTAPNWQRCRGLGYSETAASSDNQLAACTKRLFLPTGDARLIAINAETGKPCEEFGNSGTVDLTTDMGEVKPGYYQQTSTPLVAGDVVIVGGRVADNYSTGEPPGVVRAYEVRSGELVWAWDPGNPNTTKRPPTGETYTRGTPNVWSAMSYDAELGLVYLPTGNATPDFFGGQRTEFDDKRSSSIVALDVKTGQVRWHFQTTHHDLWDFDLPAQPLLYDVPDDKGDMQPALAQVTKQGEIFLLNRETGVPIVPRRRASGAARPYARRTLRANPAVLGGHAVNRQ